MTLPVKIIRIIYLFLTGLLIVSVSPPVAADIDAGRRPIESIRLIAVQADDRRTTVIFSGDGVISDYVMRSLEDPARILVDISCETATFESMNKPVSGSLLKNIRVGHHPQSIRMVLDLRGTKIPGYTSWVKNNELLITLGPWKFDIPRKMLQVSAPRSIPAKAGAVLWPAAEPVAARDKRAGGTVSGQAETSAPENKQPATKTRTAVHLPRTSESLTQVDTDNGQTDTQTRTAVHLPRTSESLTQIDTDDGQADTQKFLKCIYAYESQDWSEASRNLKELTQAFPDGRYSEKAFFLMAKAYERMYSGAISNRYNELKGYYEDAIYHFPQSVYLPDAETAIGNINFSAGNYFEALGYYNLVIEKDKDAAAVLDALMQKARILARTKKKKETLPIYTRVINRYPGTLEEILAKIELATLYFEMNSFHQSLEILGQLTRQLDDINRYPEIFRCFGNNYYQMGKYALARDHLLKYYNLYPEDEENHLILARIADSYREDGRAKDATKFYKLVLEQYPKTEGALIGMYRLAEQQERGEIKLEKKKIIAGLELVDKEISMPRKIYEDVIQNALQKDENSPLIQFALLKLSIIAQKDKDYEKSLKILKDLLKKYPRTTLRKEIEHTLKEILLPMLEKDLKIKKYKNIINVYHAERELIDRLAAPEIFLVVARASIKLNLEDIAIALFLKADPLLSQEQKPAELLFYIGRNYFYNGRASDARAYFDLLLNKPSSTEYHAEAYLLKGKLLLAGEKYTQASQAFSKALAVNQKRCAQTDILISKAKALIAMQSPKAAYQTLGDAATSSKNCYNDDYRAYEEIGELYLQIGYPQKALAIVRFAHDVEKDERIQTRLKIFMARCYETLKKESAYLAIYNEIITRNDPFWSHVAREKIEEAQFKGVMRKNKK